MNTPKGVSKQPPADLPEKGDPGTQEFILDLTSPPVFTDPSTRPTGPGGIDLRQLERHHRVTQAGWVTGKIVNCFIWAAAAIFGGVLVVVIFGVWVDLQVAETAGGAAPDLSNTTRIADIYGDLIKRAAEVLWTLFGPLLAFVFGYYFRRERS